MVVSLDDLWGRDAIRIQEQLRGVAAAPFLAVDNVAWADHRAEEDGSEERWEKGD
jgi:hypothetical protein